MGNRLSLIFYVGVCSMNRSILVFGGESTGTRFATRLMIELGYYGQDTHEQELDKHLGNLGSFVMSRRLSKVVFRRSVPHARVFPDLSKIYSTFSQTFDRVDVIITIRNFPLAALSQVRARHVHNLSAAYNNLCSAYEHIFDFARQSGVNYHVLDFSGLMMCPDVTLSVLGQRLELGLTQADVQHLVSLVKLDVDKRRVGEFRNLLQADSLL